MNNLTSTSDNLIKTRLAEADLYCSQGLNEEARLICLELLKLTGDKSHPLYTEIESRLKGLQVNGMESNPVILRRLIEDKSGLHCISITGFIVAQSPRAIWCIS